MRTTISIEDDLLAEAKRVAAESGRTLNQVVQDALRESLARRRMRPERKRIELPVHRGGRLLPGVDLDDSAGLLVVMEEPER